MDNLSNIIFFIFFNTYIFEFKLINEENLKLFLHKSKLCLIR